MTDKAVRGERSSEPLKITEREEAKVERYGKGRLLPTWTAFP